MKTAPSQMPADPEKLKPLLHEKIEHMNGRQLSLLNQVLLQVEAEELADRLNDAFEGDPEVDKRGRISELVQQFREKHHYLRRDLAGDFVR